LEVKKSGEQIALTSVWNELKPWEC